MTRRSRRYFNEKGLFKTAVKIPFKHESSFINDLFMFGRTFGHAKINENGIRTFSHITPEEFFSEFNKAAKK